MKSLIAAFLLCCASWNALADLDYYLGAGGSYNTSITTPKESLGFELGEWHARPEQLAAYYQALASESDRVSLLKIGETHERRPLMLVFISSPENIKNLEAIRQRHLSGDESAPMVTWLGFSIHGNEPSGANAAPAVAYHFVAGEDQEVLDTLRDQIIIIDPMLNPDGIARFAHWVNMYKSDTQNPDPRTMEHNEAWPRGRTNHYWFDLNRDWLPVQHPESQARVTQYQRWRPHVLTDHHEMGKHKTFFFQPGVVSRQNPLTDPENFRVTGLIAQYHAKALDNIATLYYSKEGYDDFYYGKGSTYPDAQGTIGILFEQASVRGHAQQTVYGLRIFPEAIRNQFTVALSTVEAVQKNQSSLRQNRLSSERTAQDLVAADSHSGVILTTHDQHRLQELIRILDSHKIDHGTTTESVRVNGTDYPSGSLVIRYDQPQYRLIKSMFEVRKSFIDNVFYDVSTWNMAFAMDIQYDFLSARQSRSVSTQGTTATTSEFAINTEQAVSLAIDWKDMGASRALSLLLQEGLTTVAVTKPTELVTDEGKRALTLGSIIVPLPEAKEDRADALKRITEIARTAQVDLIPIETGLATSGVDMGSPSILPVPAVRPLLLVGNGVRSYDAGEVWHFLDQRLSQPVTMVNLEQLKRTALNQYTHLLMPDGSYSLGEKEVKKIESWVRAGGHIIASARGAKWLVSQKWTSASAKTFKPTPELNAPYAQKSKLDALNVVGGSIAAGEIDITHPLGFGMDDQDISLYKRGTLAFTEPREAFVTVARFKEDAHRAGYMSEDVKSHLSGAPALLVQRLGQGRLIAFADNPLFRAYWLGTMRLYANALYYAPLIEAPTATPAPKVKPKKTN